MRDRDDYRRRRCAATLPRVTRRKSSTAAPFDDEAVVDAGVGREDHGEVRTAEDIRSVAMHSNPIDPLNSHLPSRQRRQPGGTAGKNDMCRFAIAAQPGKSQGRPVTPTGSQPIGTEGLPDGVLPDPFAGRPEPTTRPRRIQRLRHPFSCAHSNSRTETAPYRLASADSISMFHGGRSAAADSTAGKEGATRRTPVRVRAQRRLWLAVMVVAAFAVPTAQAAPAGGTAVWRADGERPLIDEWAGHSTSPDGHQRHGHHDNRAFRGRHSLLRVLRPYEFVVHDGNIYYGDRAELGQAPPSRAYFAAPRLFKNADDRWIAFRKCTCPTTFRPPPTTGMASASGSDSSPDRDRRGPPMYGAIGFTSASRCWTSHCSRSA
jgi:hypothetical protein